MKQLNPIQVYKNYNAFLIQINNFQITFKQKKILNMPQDQIVSNQIQINNKMKMNQKVQIKLHLEIQFQY